MDFFDPQGVRRLSRALSRVSAREPSMHEQLVEEADGGSQVSEELIKPTGDQFDFEKAVRTYLRK
jgi:hypothetical protein